MRSVPASAAHSLRRSSQFQERVLIRLSHPDLAADIRVADGKADLTHGGFVWLAAGLDFSEPSDGEYDLPTARVRFSPSSALADALDKSGLDGAVLEVTALHGVDEIWKYEMTVISVSISSEGAVAELGFTPITDRPACAVLLNPDNTPGLFL